MNQTRRIVYAQDVLNAVRDDPSINGKNFASVRAHIENVPTVDAVEVVRCVNCVAHGNCLTEGIFRIARIENPYCCAGKLKTNCGAKMDGGNEDGD